MTAIDHDYDEPPEPEPTDDYPWIRAWGRLNHFSPQDTDRMLRRARAEHAPPSALASWFAGDPWMVLDDVIHPPTRRWLMRYAESFDLRIPEEVMDHWLDPSYDPEKHEGQPI